MDFFNNLGIGVSEAFTWVNLWYCFLGVFLGTFIGALPGLGAMIAITVLLPITYHLPTSGALIMLTGVYFGADYGGGTSSILLGIPGHAAAAVDVLDGYPMTKKGRGGQALFMKCVASFFGSSVGIMLLMICAPLLSDLALNFGPAEYCSLMLLGLAAAATVGQGSPLKGLAMMVLGLLLSTVGIDVNTGTQRFSFGMPEFAEGIGLIPLAMGLFAVAEIVKSANTPDIGKVRGSFRLKDQMPNREEWRRSWFPMLRGAGIGSFFGTLPGSSGGMATFISYAIEKNVAREPERFGKGAIEGIAAPEACNNAGVGTAFIPTLTLGIPGDAIMALLLSAFVIQGIQPGPQIISENPDLFWGLIVSFWIGNVLLLFLNIPLIGFWVKLLQIPYPLLFPAILLFTCVGVFSEGNSVFDIYVLLGVGLLGYAMMLLRFEPVPLLLGFILGGPFEEYLRRTLLISRGDYGVFLDRPIAATALSAVVILIVWSLFRYMRALSKPAPKLQTGKES